MALSAETKKQKLTKKMSGEENRLKTFENWPCPFVSPRTLAKIGFYYIGPHDQVECHFCKIKISSWEMGDNEIIEHDRWSKNCPLLRGCYTSNISLEPISELDELLNKLNEYKLNKKSDAYEETPLDYWTIKKNEWINSCPEGLELDELKSHVNMCIKYIKEKIKRAQTPHFPEFECTTSRLETFIGWPKSVKQTPEQLSEAGFFYTQKEDRVICFSCGGGLYKWTEKDDPWEQHALHYNKCVYLQLKKDSWMMKFTINND